MKLRYLTIFSIFYIFITPALPVSNPIASCETSRETCSKAVGYRPIATMKTQTKNPIFPEIAPEKISDFFERIPGNEKTSGNQDGKNITNALPISPGNTLKKELEAHETIYFCTRSQQSIFCDIFTDTPQMLSCSFLSDTGEPLNFQKQTENNTITISYKNPSDKGQYIFIKIANKKDTNQTFQIELCNISSDSQKSDIQKSTPQPKQTIKPKNTPSTIKPVIEPEKPPITPNQTTKPKNTPDTPRQTTKPKNTPDTPRQTTKPKNTPDTPRQTTKPKNTSDTPRQTTKPKNTPDTPRQTTKPKNTLKLPTQTVKPKNTLDIPKQTLKPKNIPDFPRQTAKPKDTLRLPTQTLKPKNIPGFPKQTTKPENPLNTPKQTLQPKNIPGFPKQTTKPKNTPNTPKQTIEPKNIPDIPGQAANPADTITQNNTTLTATSEPTFSSNTTPTTPSQSPQPETEFLYPSSQTPPLEEHFLELKAGSSYQLTFHFTTPVIWSSTNPEIVSVEEGKLEIHKGGTAVIYCHYPQAERGSSCFIFSPD